MEINELKKHWNEFGLRDPLWAILSEPDKKNNKWQTKDFFASGENDIFEIMSYIDSIKFVLNKHRALDFGSGIGRLTQALCNYFTEVNGVDIAPSMHKLAKKFNQHKKRCKYFINDTDNLTIFNNNHFDFIYSNITLQHMKPLYIIKYISEFLRILHPNGLLVFQMPSGFKDIGDRKSHQNVLPEDAFNADIKLLDHQKLPNTMKCGKEYLVDLMIINKSQCNWINDKEHTICVGNHWLDNQNNMVALG